MGKKKKDETRKEKYLAAEENLSKRVKVKKTGKTEKEIKPEKEDKLAKEVKTAKKNKPEKKDAKGRKSGKNGKKAVKVKASRLTAEEILAKALQEEMAKEAAVTEIQAGFPQYSALSPQEAAMIFRALGDESRMQILGFLQEGELRIADLQKQMKLVQSTLSHHMKVLTESGIVTSRREGISTYYVICEDTFERVAAYLTSLGKSSR